MESSKKNIFVYSSNNFITFTIKEILAKNFDCDAICLPVPKDNVVDILSHDACDVIIFDSSLLFDLQFRKELHSRSDLKAIILVNGEVDYGLRQIINSHADGMIDCTFEMDAIVMIITAVMKGFQCLPKTPLADENQSSQLSLLTQREREVLDYVSQGLPNKTIADFLGVSYKTVCVHRYNIMYKLKVDNLSAISKPEKLYHQ